jgi:hypothetical protein
MNLPHSLALLSVSALVVCAETTTPGYDVALIGDMPYGSASEPKYERVIAEINRTSSVELTGHIGDTKSGSTRCDDSPLRQVARLVQFLREAAALLGRQ